MKRQTLLKSTLCLLMALVCSVAWAQTATIEVSTSVDTPENTYSLLSKNGAYMSAGTGATQYRLGRFAFYAAEGENVYKIYSVDAKKWVSYTKADSYDGGANKATLVDAQANAQAWRVVANGNYYNIAPLKNDGTLGGQYWNFHGGAGASNKTYIYDDNKTVGFYDQAGDGGSLWTLEKLTLATEEQVNAAKALVVVGPGYPKTSSSVYAAINALAVGKSTTKHVTLAKDGYVAATDILFPEDGKAYKMAFVANNDNKTLYYFTAKGNTRGVTADDEDASKFYCKHITTNQGLRYVFISEEGKFLAYRELTDNYTYSGNLLNNWNVEAMVGKSSGYITSTKDKRLGTVCMTAPGRASNDATAACFILKFTANPPSFDNSGAPYHNGTFTSAILLTEVANYTTTQNQQNAIAEIELGTAKINALANVASKVPGVKVCQYTYSINGEETTDASTINKAINNATTTEQVNAITAKMNLPQEGKFYRIKNSNGERYLSSGTGTGRTKFLTGLGNKASSIFLYTGNKLVSYVYGTYLANSNNFLHYTETLGANAGTKITFVESGTACKVGIKFNNDNRSLYSNNTDNSNAAGSSSATGTDANYHFTVEEVEWLPVEIIPSVGYATLYSPVQLGFNNRVTAYTASLSEDKEWLKLVEQEVVPANTGVVLTFEEGVEVEVENDKKYVYLPVQSTSVNNVKSDLAGTLEKSATGAGNIYTLQKPEGYENVVFMQYEGESLAANKAYLVLPAGAGAISIRFEGSTDIENVEIRNEKSEMIFDLFGRRVEAITKGGIYIVNGKKVVVK